MITERNAVTQDRLKFLFRYEENTGNFIRLIKTAKRSKIGEIAGTQHNKGYWIIMVDGVIYLAHRLAWLYMTGQWPDDQVDHIDMDRKNNKWSNLREATQTDNQGNKRVRLDSKNKLKGVFKSGSKFWSSIRHSGKTTYLGTFDCPAAAHFAYTIAAHERFGPYARSR